MKARERQSQLAARHNLPQHRPFLPRLAHEIALLHVPGMFWASSIVTNNQQSLRRTWTPYARTHRMLCRELRCIQFMERPVPERKLSEFIPFTRTMCAQILPRGITISTSVVQNTEWQQQDPNVRPPAARRAASTGAIGFAGPSRASPAVSDESPSRGGAWTPGMPLPPPPPGPPPSGSRSASTSRTPESLSASASSSSAAPPPLRRRPQTGSTLGPIPPTPAGWVDDELRNRSRSPAARGLHLDTAAASSGSSWASSGSLSRSGAQRRDSSSRGIRERRSESRAAKERMTEARTAVDYSNNPWAHDMDAAAKPADLVLSSSTSSALSRRRAVARNSRVFSSPAASPELPLKSPRNLADLGEPSSSQSTPRTGGLKLVTTSPESLGGATPTPPFSPGVEGGSSSKTTGPSPALPPKTLPTPPPQQFHEQSFSALSVPKNKDRPVSHILHVPNEEISMPAPLSPMRPPSAGVTRSTSPGRTGKQSAKPSDKELFAQAAVERHKAFVEKEIAAQSDQERLELFAEFIVGESRIRRDRYKVAFDAMASDILDLTRDMWRSYNTTGRRSATPGASTAPSTGMDRSVDGQATVASSVSPHSNYTSRTEPESPSSTKSRNRGDSQLWDRFEPCLSPIPSMNVSTVPDEEDSRGRSSSRWWEASADGSQGRGKKVMRTKRESKYMGVPKEAREHLQWDAENSPAYTATPGPIDYSGYGPNEYPPEKVGLHEDGSLPASAHSYHLYTHSAPTTPDPFRLDVSRLVTLPPPYPRHYPAVNNHHPDLASLRTIHRNLGELEEVNAIKELYLKKTNARREQERVDSGERRNKLRRGTQEQIRADLISFQDAAKAEYDFEVSEARRAQEIAQMEFDSFKKDVNQRLTAILSERITKATATIDHLRSSLCQDAQDPSPNQPQEEGDEQPELLEKLTLLKWLFESREASHREMFDLEGESNDRYKTVVLTPYIRANNHEKVKEAENFFAQDAQERQVIFEKETLKRFEDFVTVIESMVTRGVEVQLSAFWDIAPGLMTVVQKVPPNLDASFQILIPPDEYRENPVYHDHPLQYLHTLLTHAKKSTYQFIESQTNLLCLLHEVKTGVMTANTRLLETQRLMDGGEDEHAIKAEMGDLRAYEERRLTDDLKDKVALVEEQWEEGLGSGLEDCLKRVERFLEETGGWDEGLDE